MIPIFRLLVGITVILSAGRPASAQNSGALAPALPPQFFNASGAVAASAKLCTIKAGTTTTWQATYSDNALASVLPNPITLNALGQPTTNGSTTTAVYLSGSGGGSYKFILYAAGTGNTCNGTAVGAAIWTRDNVYDLGQLIVNGLATITSLNNRQYCVTGANFGAKFTAAAALLPSTGGIVDCSNLQGAQTIASDVFTGQTKPITLIWPTGTASSSLSLSIPATTTIDFPEGGILSMAVATTATVLGEVRGTMSQHFAGSGNVSFLGSATLSRTQYCFPQWWGATGDGTTDDTAAMFTAVQMCHDVFIPDGEYLVNNLTRRTIGTTSYAPGAIWAIDNQTITLSRRANIITRSYVAGDDCSGRIISVYGVANVTIQGGRITGNYSYPTVPGARAAACAIGSNHGIEIGNSTNVSVRDMLILNNWGDAWTVSSIGDLAGVANSTNVNFINVRATQNYRNGGSCVSWDGGTVVGGEYSYTNGAASPLAGIDFEPNGVGANLTQVCRNISVIHPKFSNNGTSDIQAINASTSGLTIDATGTFIVQNVRGAKIMDAIGASAEPGVTVMTFAGTGAATGNLLGRTDFYNSDTVDGNGVVVRVEGERGTSSLTGRYDIQTRGAGGLTTRVLVDDVAIATQTEEFRAGSSVVTAIGTGSTFAAMGAANNGTLKYCSDCTVTSGADNTCTSGSDGALAVRLAGAWRCFKNQN